MRKLLNTLYVTTETAYLSLDGENVVVNNEDEEKRFPLSLFENIVYFGYKGASPYLMGACADRNIRLSFFTPKGRFLASAAGKTKGNVYLRQIQTMTASDEKVSNEIAKSFIHAKVYNSLWVLRRFVRDYSVRTDTAVVSDSADYLASRLEDISAAGDSSVLRGIEGDCAGRYFDVFDNLILQKKDSFFFNGRSRRPPLDNVNAMLSFAYSILANECSAALESVGLDPYIGFMHTLRSGRSSLALDLMEELRSAFADRFVISLINNRQASESDFIKQENGAILMKDDFRKKFLSAWQLRKKEIFIHPFLKEKIEWGLVPYVQAMLLSRFLREDMDAYPPFFHK